MAFMVLSNIPECMSHETRCSDKIYNEKLTESTPGKHNHFMIRKANWSFNTVPVQYHCQCQGGIFHPF